LKSDADATDLVARLKAIPGVAGIGASDLLVAGDPYCSVLALLARPEMRSMSAAAQDATLIGRPAQARVLKLSKGMPIELHWNTPDFPAFVYVDYYSSDGKVFHLLPSRDFGREMFPPGKPVGIGRPGDPGPQLRVAPPFGLDVVVVLESSVRLFDEDRPAGGERANAYLSALQEAIDRSSANLAYEYQLVFTSGVGGQ
jgi:hypothetical protein